MKNELIECAKAIRKELKAKYPNIKFSVTSERFSQGSAVEVRYSKYASANLSEVSDLLKKYQAYVYDGMNDYGTRLPENGLPRARFVSVSQINDL